jgi:hypothetical protein
MAINNATVETAKTLFPKFLFAKSSSSEVNFVLIRPSADQGLSVGLVDIRVRRLQSRNLDCELNLPEINPSKHHRGGEKIYAIGGNAKKVSRCTLGDIFSGDRECRIGIPAQITRGNYEN